MEEGIIPRSKYEDAAQYVKEEILRGAEFITGIACSSQAEWARSVGYVVQGVVGGQVVSNLQKEIEYYSDKGRIKKDFVASSQGQRCFVELLRFLEQEIPDQDRIEILKRIYIVSATEEIHDRESPLPLQFMQVARSLSHGEIVVLFAAYRAQINTIVNSDARIDMILEKTGLKYRQLVHMHLQSLMVKRLMDTNTNTILPMGEDFCEFVCHYDEKIVVPPME